MNLIRLTYSRVSTLQQVFSVYQSMSSSFAREEYQQFRVHFVREIITVSGTCEARFMDCSKVSCPRLERSETASKLML